MGEAHVALELLVEGDDGAQTSLGRKSLRFSVGPPAGPPGAAQDLAPDTNKPADKPLAGAKKPAEKLSAEKPPVDAKIPADTLPVEKAPTPIPTPVPTPVQDRPADDSVVTFGGTVPGLGGRRQQPERVRLQTSGRQDDRHRRLQMGSRGSVEHRGQD